MLRSSHGTTIIAIGVNEGRQDGEATRTTITNYKAQKRNEKGFITSLGKSHTSTGINYRHLGRIACFTSPEGTHIKKVQRSRKRYIRYTRKRGTWIVVAKEVQKVPTEKRHLYSGRKRGTAGRHGRFNQKGAPTHTTKQNNPRVIITLTRRTPTPTLYNTYRIEQHLPDESIQIKYFHQFPTLVCMRSYRCQVHMASCSPRPVSAPRISCLRAREGTCGNSM